MKKILLLRRLIFVFILPIAIVSCNPKEKEKVGPVYNFTNNVFITNEGGYGKSNGSVSCFNRDNKNVVNDAFRAVNERPLGDVVQSLTFINGKGYIVVNNSAKIEVVDAITLKSITVISGLEYPRYITGVSNSKAYITESVDPYGYSSGKIRVFDLNSNATIKTIQAGLSPDKMLYLNGKLYVANSSDSTIFIVNTTTDLTEDTIKINHNPNGIVKDADNNIWVLCGGKKVYAGPPTYELDLTKSTAGSLIKMNAAGSVVSTLAFSDNSKSPTNLTVNSSGNTLYYSYGGKVYELATSASSLSTVPLINKSFYGFAVDPENDYLLGGAATNWSSDDYFYRYTSAGVKVDSFKVGIAPNGFSFN